MMSFWQTEIAKTIMGLLLLMDFRNPILKPAFLSLGNLIWANKL